MKIKTLLIGTFILLGLALSAWAADITGKWVAQAEGRQGTRENTFNFMVAGTKVTGTMTTGMGETAISEGKIEGDELSFVIVRSFGENEMKILYKGTVSGDEIKLTREFQGGMMGGRGGGTGGPPGGGPPIEGAIGAAPGDPGAATPLVFMAFKSFVIVLTLDCKLEICVFKSAKDPSTRSGILKTIVIIFSTISPNAFTFSSIVDFLALSRKLANSSAHILILYIKYFLFLLLI